MGTTQLLIIAAMLLLNGLFAAYELALASVRPDRLKFLEGQHRRGARAAVAMKDRMEASLAVVQLGITLVGATAAAVGGANVGVNLAPYLEARLAISPGAAEALALGIFVVPLSGITIIAGELIPKVLAIKNAEAVCLALSPLMRVFGSVAFPAVWLFEKTTKLVVSAVERLVPRAKRTFGADQQSSLNELRMQASLLRTSKVIGVQEEKIILQASRLSRMKVRDIMLPAADIVMLRADAPLTDNLIAAHLDLHTRFPVTQKPGDVNSIIGYVNFKELIFLSKTHPHNPVLREITRPLISLPADLAVSEALRRMVNEHLHLALVRESSSAGGAAGGQGVIGMITQEDIFEELVGDIEDEFDRLPRTLTPSGRQWVVGGGAAVGRLRQALGRPDLAPGVAADISVNDWLTDFGERRVRGGDTLNLDGLHVLVRKVRRQKVTEAVFDAEAGTGASGGASGGAGAAGPSTNGPSPTPPQGGGDRGGAAPDVAVSRRAG